MSPNRLALARRLVLAVAVVVTVVRAAAAQPIPGRPETLTFKPIVFEPPAARDYRVVLKGGMVVYIADDQSTTKPLLAL